MRGWILGAMMVAVASGFAMNMPLHGLDDVNVQSGEAEGAVVHTTETHPSSLQDYLDAGDLVNGELEFESILQASPDDDDARLALGMLRLVRGVERLGQSLHRYGARSNVSVAPVMRLPVPENEDPAPLNYASFRRIFEEFYRDVERVESTLAPIKDDQIKLELSLSKIQLDLTSDGNPSEAFGQLLTQLLRGEPDFLNENPDFLVHFDRGDVAWTRAYCHLVMSIIDFYLACDTHPEFCSMAPRQFPKVVVNEEATAVFSTYPRSYRVIEPRRLGRARRHLIQVAKLNHETWDHIRAETDDSYEWLPNAKQQRGVLGLPVRDEMIDAWLAMVDELEALLEGERAFLSAFWGKEGKGLNLKVFLEQPPESVEIDFEWMRGLPDRYYTEAQDINLAVLFRVMGMMRNTTGVGYAAWFN